MKRLHVLVVDDSAVVRQAMSAILTHEGFDVTTASDPIIAGDRLRSFTPDVILLDIEMPRMDGISFLSKIMQDSPLPVVICSAEAGRGTDKALRALEQGAVDIVAKPRLGVREFLYESAVTLSDTVRAAAVARIPRRRHPAQTLLSAPKIRADRSVCSTRVVAMGASTGGTDALRVILTSLERNAAGVVVVQHMPAHFTKAFAKSLDAICTIDVREAESGDLVTRGTALIAPGDRHLTVFAARGGGFAVEVSDGPLVSRHRPSVDVLFESVARVAGSHAAGVILTGMGNDGAAGLARMRARGARTIAQDEATSVVFGMPKEAIAIGAAEQVLPLSEIAAALGEGH
jgi:two-component system, chemotaxis family, protein-glutamate methylesterase/glutaminase